MPPGPYEIRLDDKALFKLRQKHAAIELIQDGQNVIRLHGTQRLTFQVGNADDSDDDTMQFVRIGAYVVLGIIILVVGWMCCRRRTATVDEGSSAEMRPLVR